MMPTADEVKQYWRFRRQYLDIEILSFAKRLEAIKVARQLSLLDPSVGSVSNPSASNVVHGDAKVLNGPVLAVDGWPGVIVPTVGGPKWVAMEPVQIKKTRTSAGTWRWWQYWRVRDLRDLPEIPKALRGAVVHVRHSRSDDDGDRSRSVALRLHPEGSDTYRELYRRRNDIESMHRHLQDLMFNDRVSSVGDHAMRVWLHSYQTLVNRTALLAWHYRTGGDITPWFGNHRPPPRHRAAAA